MEIHNKRSMTIFSVAQIVLSVIFFTLGMADGFNIRYGYVSLLFTPCWMTALSLPIGVMGLVLAYRRTPSSLLVTATWSGSLACIMYSAMTVFVYRRWGIEVLLFQKYYWAEYSFDSNPSDFVKKGTKLEYTYEEKTALAVFILIIIFSIIEIILAAAIAKTSGASHQAPQMLQPSPMHYMYYQAGQDGGQAMFTNPHVPQIHNGTAGNQHVSSGDFVN